MYNSVGLKFGQNIAQTKYTSQCTPVPNSWSSNLLPIGDQSTGSHQSGINSQCEDATVGGGAPEEDIGTYTW